MFVATIFIVIILLTLIVASGLVKGSVQKKDSLGIYNESDVGVDDVFDYADEQFYNVTKLRGYVDYRFDDMAQLRILVRDGNWSGWLTEEMKR